MLGQFFTSDERRGSGAAAGVGSRGRVVGFALGGFGDAGGDIGWGGEVDGAVQFDGVGEGVLELLDAFAGDCGDGEERELFALCEGGELLELVGVGDVDFGGDEDGGFESEGGIEGFELGGDDVVVGDGVGGLAFSGLGGDGGVGDVDEVDEDAGAFDVFEELDAEARAEMGAFDEAGHVGDGEAALVGGVTDLDDAEVGFEGGEGVVGDLGFGGGEAGDEGGFADVGEADEAGVGEETEFEAIVFGFTGAS